MTTIILLLKKGLAERIYKVSFVFFSSKKPSKKKGYNSIKTAVT